MFDVPEKAEVLTRIPSVSARRIIQNKYGGQIGTDGRQIFRVTAEIESAMLSVITPLQYIPFIVQFIGYCCSVYFHTSSEHHQFEPMINLKTDLKINKRQNIKRSIYDLQYRGSSRHEVFCAQKT
jgi:hypothetical protein